MDQFNVHSKLKKVVVKLFLLTVNNFRFTFKKIIDKDEYLKYTKKQIIDLFISEIYDTTGLNKINEIIISAFLIDDTEDIEIYQHISSYYCTNLLIKYTWNILKIKHLQETQ